MEKNTALHLYSFEMILKERWYDLLRDAVMSEAINPKNITGEVSKDFMIGFVQGLTDGIFNKINY